MSINKTTLRVVFARNPPDIYDDCQKFPTIVPSFECPFPGWTAEVLGMVSDYLRWQVKPLIMPVASGATANTDSWHGLLGYLDRDEADTVCLTYEYVDFRDQYFDYSYPVYNVKVVYVAKRKAKNLASALWNSFSPFPYSVWLIILAFLVIQATYATFVRYIEWKIGYERVFYPLEKYWQYLKFFLLQPEETKAFKSAAGVLVFAVFLVLQVLVFTNMYKVSVLSALLKTPDLVPFHSSDEMTRLIASGQYKMITHKLAYEANWYFSDLKISQDTHFINLREALKKNPIFIVENSSVALAYLKKGGYIYPSTQDSSFIPFLQGQCDLYYFSDDTPQKSAYFIFRNGSHLLKQWNHGLIMNIDYIAHTFSKYFENGLIGPPYPRCVDPNSIPDAYKPLDMMSTFGIYVIISICFLVCLMTFSSEIYINWYRTKIRAERKAQEEEIFQHSIFSRLSHFFGGVYTTSREPTRENSQYLSMARVVPSNNGSILLAGVPVESHEHFRYVKSF